MTTADTRDDVRVTERATALAIVVVALLAGALLLVSVLWPGGKVAGVSVERAGLWVLLAVPVVRCLVVAAVDRRPAVRGIALLLGVVLTALVVRAFW